MAEPTQIALRAFFSLKALYPSASPPITAMNGLGPMPVWGNRSRLRVLRFCAKYPRWHTLMELDQVSLLEDDDVLTVPPLIERQLLRHDPAIKAVRITPAGEVWRDNLDESSHPDCRAAAR